jgi:sensor histidine kinase regulating citrate/malate metabolism
MIMLGTCANCIAYLAVEPFIPDKGAFLVAEPAWWIVNALAVAMAMPFIYRIFNGLLRTVLSELPAKNVFSLCAAPFVFYIMASLYVVLMGAFSSMFVAFIAVFAGLLMTYVQLRMVQSIRDLRTQEIKAESLLQNYNQLNDHFHEINRLKHDMRNHLSMLSLFLKDNRIAEAKNYLEKYADEVEYITEAAFHENYIINAVAHDLSHRGQLIGTKVELSLKASPLHISEPDLISLLTNITDNSLEACAKMPQGAERLIRLSVTRREPYLAIVCENSYPGGIDTADSGDAVRSSKSESGHGYGLKTIERIASAYDGMVEFSHDENLFTITVALKDKKEEEGK